MVEFVDSRLFATSVRTFKTINYCMPNYY